MAKDTYPAPPHQGPASVPPSSTPWRVPTPSEIVLNDPYVTAATSEYAASVELRFPVFDAAALGTLIPGLRRRAAEIFSLMPIEELQASIDRLDRHFAALSGPEIETAIRLIQKVDGFSRHDIEHFILGSFARLAADDRALAGKLVEAAFRTRLPVETSRGYVKRFGTNFPLRGRRREPGLVGLFISGNIVEHAASLARTGLPARSGGKGAAQIVILPSTCRAFSLLYLAKMAEVAPLVRETMACAGAKWGDRELEDIVLANSDAAVVVGSAAMIGDVSRRAERLRRRMPILAHGPKVGAAYVAHDFVESPGLRRRAIEGLVRDISAFDGAASFSTKNIYVQGRHAGFAEELAEGLATFARNVSPVNWRVKQVGQALKRSLRGAPSVIDAPDGSAFVRVRGRAEFWMPEEAYRYVQVMPVENAEAAAGVMRERRPFLQTVVAAVPDDEILEALVLFGDAGASNIHHPGSAPLLNAEEPRDGDFDGIKLRLPYRARFASANFKRNADWL